MNSYLSHISALNYWDVPYLHVVFGYSSAEQLEKACLRKSQRTYFEQSERPKDECIEAHSQALSFPRGSYLRQDKDLVASPELAFFQLANKLSFHRAVLLGMQLCSAKPSENFLEREVLTTPRKINEFIKKCHRHRGSAAAAQAAKYITGNSLSVMESLLFMVLTLPNKYGGFGLSGAKLNHEILLHTGYGGKRARKAYADLCWEQARLIVEYDSYAFHNQKESWIKDAKRSAMLENNGYRVITVTTEQLYNEQAFLDVASVIAKTLGKRLQLRAVNYKEEKARLWGLLPRRDVGIEIA